MAIRKRNEKRSTKTAYRKSGARCTGEPNYVFVSSFLFFTFSISSSVVLSVLGNTLRRETSEVSFIYDRTSCCARWFTEICALACLFTVHFLFFYFFFSFVIALHRRTGRRIPAFHRGDGEQKQKKIWHTNWSDERGHQLYLWKASAPIKTSEAYRKQSKTNSTQN